MDRSGRKRALRWLQSFAPSALLAVATSVFLDRLDSSTRELLRQHLVLVALLPLCVAFLVLLAWQLYVQHKR